MFEEKESFKHKMAKDLLYEWLVSIETEKRNNNDPANDDCYLEPFSWRPNYGIYKELKFHETDDPYYFENSEGLMVNGENEIQRNSKNPLDWFDPNYDRGRILFVPDITIFRKGIAHILIEITHSNPISRSKILKVKEFFYQFTGLIEVYEIEAEEILKQTKIPNKLNCRKIELESDRSNISKLIDAFSQEWKPTQKKDFIETLFYMLFSMSDLDVELYLIELSNISKLRLQTLIRDFSDFRIKNFKLKSYGGSK